MNAIRTVPLALRSSICALLLGHALLHAQYHPIPPSQPALYKTIVSGDLDGNLSPEVAVIHGTELVVFQNPDTSADTYSVATDAVDVCYWPTAGGPGAPGLLYTTPNGLAVATFDSGYDGTAPPYLVALISYPLQGILRVRHVPDDGGQEKFFFLQSDAKSFHSAVASGGVIASPVFHFTLPGALTASDFVPLDYANSSGDPGIDLGISHSNGVNVRSQNNVVYVARSAIYPGADAIARVRHPSSAGMKDSLAWVTRLAGQIPNLLLFNPLFFTPQNPAIYVKVPLSTSPSVLYASATAADVNGDGTEDVVIGRTISEIRVQRLGSVASPLIFTGEQGTVDMSHPAGSPTAMGRIVCANLFNEFDGNDVARPGFAAMLTDLNGLRMAHNDELVFPGPPQVPPPYNPDFDGVTYESARYRMDTTCQAQSPSDPLLRARWTIGLAHGWGFVPLANHIELIVRRCPSGLTALEPQALAHLIFQIPPGTYIHEAEIPFLSGSNENQAANWDTENLNSRYFAMVRPIQLNASGGLQRAWRWSILGFSANCEAEPFLLERQNGDALPISPWVCGDINCGIGFGGGRLPPKAVPQSTLPTTSPNVLPIIPPAPWNP